MDKWELRMISFTVGWNLMPSITGHGVDRFHMVLTELALIATIVRLYRKNTRLTQ
jgi:hypothetical protein